MSGGGAVRHGAAPLDGIAHLGAAAVVHLGAAAVAHLAAAARHGAKGAAVPMQIEGGAETERSIMLAVHEMTAGGHGAAARLAQERAKLTDRRHWCGRQSSS